MMLLRPLRQRAVALLWGGLATSAIGDQLYAVAITWIAVEALGAAAGYLSALQAGVTLMVALAVGGWADRRDNRAVMIGADAARAAALGLLVALAIAAGHISAIGLVAAVFVLAAGQAIFRPALQAILPSLVNDRALLPAANALLDTTERIARLAGPGLIAALADVLAPIDFLALDAMTFAVSALAVWRIGARTQAPHTHIPGSPGMGGPVMGGPVMGSPVMGSPVMGSPVMGGPVMSSPVMGSPVMGRKFMGGTFMGSMFMQMRRGFVAMRADPLLGYLLAITAIHNGVWYAAIFLGLPLALAHEGAGTIGDYGLAIAAYGVGNLAANLIVGSRPVPHRPAPLIFGGNIVNGAGLALIGMAAALDDPWRLPAICGASALAGAGGPMNDIPRATLVQLMLPPGDIAASMRAWLAANNAGMLIAMAAAPGVVAAIGPRATVMLCGVVVLMLGVFGLLRHAAHAPLPPSPTPLTIR